MEEGEKLTGQKNDSKCVCVRVFACVCVRMRVLNDREMRATPNIARENHETKLARGSRKCRNPT